MLGESNLKGPFLFSYFKLRKERSGRGQRKCIAEGKKRSSGFRGGFLIKTGPLMAFTGEQGGKGLEDLKKRVEMGEMLQIAD